MALAEIRVAIAFWQEDVTTTGPSGKAVTQRLQKRAKFGERVEIPQDEYDRLLDAGAVQVPGSNLLPGAVPYSTPSTTPAPLQSVPEANEIATPAPVAPTPTLDTDVEELLKLITSGGPDGRPLNTEGTVALAGNNPAIAVRVLDAEEATGDPRSGVTALLQKIIDSA